MTKLAVISVRDKVASVFGRPFFAPNIPAAVRSIANEVSNRAEGNVLHTNTADFEIYSLGHFDDDSGLFDLHPQPQFIEHCSNLISSTD